MRKKYIFIICIIFIVSCDNSFTNTFFEFIFNSKSINITRKCSDNPSLFSEGRSFEVYSMSEVDVELTVRNIFDKSNFSKSNKYSQYKIPEWKNTPVINKTDSVYSFIQNEMKDEINTCFKESTLTSVLKQKGNYYTFLYDNLGRAKLFIWDVKREKLFLLTSYEL